MLKTSRIRLQFETPRESPNRRRQYPSYDFAKHVAHRRIVVDTVPRTIAEADWKVLKRLHPVALERFCDRVLAQIERVTHLSTQSAHQRYLDIFKTIEQRDRDMAGIFDDPKRSNALTMLARMRSEGLLMEDKFSSLTPETRGAIQSLLGAE
jgi:hypothetical protein